MPLNATPVPRNLGTKVTFLFLEFDDLIVILGVAVVMNLVGSQIHRTMFGIPMNVFLQYIVPVLTVPLLVGFKYGKPRGYTSDIFHYLTKPHVYCSLERDSEQTVEYLKGETE